MGSAFGRTQAPHAALGVNTHYGVCFNFANSYMIVSMKQFVAWVVLFLFVLIFVRLATIAEHRVFHAPNVATSVPVYTADIPVVEQLTASSAPATSTTAQSALYDVLRVIDGDTIDILYEGEKTRIRLIGINTPETVDPRRTVECFGKEASAKTTQLLSGQRVRIEIDASQGRFDKYGRMLAYVFTEDGVFVNQTLIAEGFAYEYTYRTPYRYQAEFKSSESDARTYERGLWAPGVCAKL